MFARPFKAVAVAFQARMISSVQIQEENTTLDLQISCLKCEEALMESPTSASSTSI
jgi:hypothetical protein